MNNLDYVAAKHGQPLGFEYDVQESVINDALSILHQQGIYALFMWLHEKPKVRGTIGAQIQSLFRDSHSPIVLGDNLEIWTKDSKNVNRALNTVRDTFSLELRVMFLARDMISQLLVYGRHAAKIRAAEDPQPAPDSTS